MLAGATVPHRSLIIHSHGRYSGAPAMRRTVLVIETIPPSVNPGTVTLSSDGTCMAGADLGINRVQPRARYRNLPSRGGLTLKLVFKCISECGHLGR